MRAFCHRFLARFCAFFALGLAFSLVSLALSESAIAQVPSHDSLRLEVAGTIHALSATPDGGMIIGGQFSSVNGVPRSNLARLNSDGSLDMNWRVDADQPVWTLAIDSDGSIFAGGNFFQIGGVSRYNLAKIDPSGAVDTWDASGSGTGVFALAIDNTGYLYVAGGQFPTGLGTVTSGLAKLSTAIAAADGQWNPASTVGGTFQFQALAADQGFLYVGGYFPSGIGGQQIANLARLSTSGTGAPDPNWNPAVANGQVYALALDKKGHLFAGGDFFYAGGLERGGLAKISTGPTATIDPNWAPGVGAKALALDGMGSIYIGGGSSIVKVSVNSTGPIDPNWSHTVQGDVLSIALKLDGTVAVGGSISQFDDVGRIGYCAVASDGTLQLAANVGDGPGQASAITLQPSGGIVVAGLFALADGIARQNVARLLPDGQLDLQWDPGLNSTWGAGAPIALASDSNGDIFISGGFSKIGGQDRNQLAKLSGAGAGLADALWNPGPSYQQTSVSALGVDGTALYVGGSFYSLGGASYSNLTRLSTTGVGSADTTWNPAPDREVTSLAIAPDHTLFVGGFFTHMGTTNRNYLAKIDSNGNVDSLWDPNADDVVNAVALDGQGALYVAGAFSNIGGQAMPNVGKLNAIGLGKADPNWNPAVANGQVKVLAVADSFLYVGGGFSLVQGLTCAGLIRLSTANGLMDKNWIPTLHDDYYGPDNDVLGIAVGTDGTIFAVGTFTGVGQVDAFGFARFPDRIFANGFE